MSHPVFAWSKFTERHFKSIIGQLDCKGLRAAGGFAITATVHILHLKDFEPIVRPTVLTGVAPGLRLRTRYGATKASTQDAFAGKLRRLELSWTASAGLEFPMLGGGILLEARYDYFSRIAGSRFDGLSLTAGVRVFDLAGKPVREVALPGVGSAGGFEVLDGAEGGGELLRAGVGQSAQVHEQLLAGLEAVRVGKRSADDRLVQLVSGVSLGDPLIGASVNPGSDDNGLGRG